MAWGAYAWAECPWAAVTTAEPVETPIPPGPVPVGNVQVLIKGFNYTNNLRISSLSILDEIGTRRTCEFELFDDQGTVQRSTVGLGAEVVILIDETKRLFAGTIDQLEETLLEDSAVAVTFTVTCVDFSQLADRHLVTHHFAATTFKQIVKDIVQIYSGEATTETLEDEGVIVSDAYLPADVSVKEATFNFVTCSKAFDDLCEDTGYSWHIDYFKVLRFTDIMANAAPYELDDAKWQEYGRVRVTREREKYRNIQYLRAGKGLTSKQTEEFYGDGKTKTFSLALPVGAKPVLAVDAVPILETNIGIRGNDADETKAWFYQIGDEQISQNTGASFTALTSAKVLTVEYYGQYPLIVEARADDEIASRKEIEGGVGIYMQLETDDEVDSRDLATQKVRGLLRRYSRTGTHVSFTTTAGGFASGQWLVVNLPALGVSGVYFIEKVEISYVDDSFFRYTVDAIYGESQGSWTTWFRDLASQRPIVIAENEKINYLRQRRHTIVMSDVMTLELPLEAWNIDPRRSYIVGLSTIGGTRAVSFAAHTADPTAEAGDVYGPLIGMPYP